MPNRPNPLEQRRHFSRVLFNAAACLGVDGGDRPCTVSDLSFKGALLRITDAPVPAPGTPCRLELRLADDDARIFMDATVAHVEGERVGIHCDSIDLDSISHLRRLVELNLGDESLLQRDFSALIAGS